MASMACLPKLYLQRTNLQETVSKYDQDIAGMKKRIKEMEDEVQTTLEELDKVRLCRECVERVRRESVESAVRKSIGGRRGFGSSISSSPSLN